MRNIHTHIEIEYGKENVQTFRRWEKLEYKMADFENHCRFTLRCLSKEVIPVSVRLKSTIKTPKGRDIIRKQKGHFQMRELGRSITLSPCSRHKEIHV